MRDLPSSTWQQDQAARKALYALLAASCLWLALAFVETHAPATDPPAHKVAVDLRMAIDAAQVRRRPAYPGVLDLPADR